jgi:hypothetical protein
MRELGKVCTTVDRRINSLEGAMKRTPATGNGKVRPRRPPRRQPNRATRTREHLTPTEVEKLITAAGTVGRYGHRDSTLLLLAYRPTRKASMRGELSGEVVVRNAIRATFPACCASAASGAARRPPDKAPMNVRRSIICHQPGRVV